jgi:hypothetical protein
MSKKVVHVIGNGMMAQLYDPQAKGLKLCCNLAPFPVDDAYASCIVDFKMMRSMTEGSIQVPGQWILGMRPKKWMESNPDYNIKVASQIKEYYTAMPKYCKSYTDFNCGHFDLRSCTDFYLSSVRDGLNTHRLNENWRPIWWSMWREFPEIKWKLYHKHDNAKVELSDNVEVVVMDPKATKKLRAQR